MVSGNLALNFRNMRERLIPTRFQFVRDKSIGRIDRVILSEGAISGVARRLQITVQGIAHLVPPLARFPLRSRRGRDGAGADDGEQGVFDGVIDPQTAEGDAARFGIVHPAAATTITRNLMLHP